MDILYYGLASDNERFQKHSHKSNSPYMVAQQMFEVAMIEGLEKRENVKLFCNYILQDNSYPKSKTLYVKNITKKLTKKTIVKYIPYINLPAIRFVSLFFSTLLRTAKWCLKYRNSKQKVILSAVNYLPVSYANMIVSKLFNVNNACIFTDSTAFLLLNERIKKMSFIKRLVIPIYTKLVRQTERSYDGYIFFSKYMDEVINKNKKPYIVMEGIFNPDGLDLKEVKKEKAIMYAGSLFEEYGIKLFLDAFKLIQDKDMQLWIFGGGEMVDYIQKLSKEDSRIKYMGFKPRDEVFEYEKKATLLINTRFSKDLYTKLSFPSKTFEYMVSGTPFLTTKIGGIPSEYYQYLYTIDIETPDQIKQKIINIFEESNEERLNFGIRARNFILQNKNAEVQTRKIYEFLENLTSER